MKQVIEQYQNQFNGYLEQIISEHDFPCQQLSDAINYTTLSGGKRLRPILVYLCGNNLDVKPQVLNIIATAIELVHCYSLIHDDLPAMDDDDLRRGQPSCHKAFSEATAILTGDALQALAFEHLLTLEEYLPASNVIKIAKAFTHAMGADGMISGQSLDLHHLSQADVSLKTLQTIHTLKTGKMISLCIETVIYADDNHHESHYESLLAFAKLLGLAFQIQDDYLDKYASTKDLGKQQGSDDKNDKTTYNHFYNQQQLADLVRQTYSKANDALSANHTSSQLQAFGDYLATRIF